MAVPSERGRLSGVVEILYIGLGSSYRGMYVSK